MGRSVLSRSGSYRGTSFTGTGDLQNIRPVTHARQRKRYVAQGLRSPKQGTAERRKPDRRPSRPMKHARSILPTDAYRAAMHPCQRHDDTYLVPSRPSPASAFGRECPARASAGR